MKVSYTAYCEAGRLAAEQSKKLVISQLRFVAADFDGDAEGRTWAVVDDEWVIAEMRRQIVAQPSHFFVNGRPVPIHYDPVSRPLLVIHTVT